MKEIKDIPGITVSEIRRYGRSGAEELSSGMIDFVAKVKIELVVSDQMV